MFLKRPYAPPALNRVPFNNIPAGPRTLRHAGVLRRVESALAANDILLIEGYKAAMHDLIRPLERFAFSVQPTSPVASVESLRLELLSGVNVGRSDVCLMLFDLRDPYEQHILSREILNASANERIGLAFLVSSIEAFRKSESASPNSCWQLKADLAPVGLAELLKSYFRLHCPFLKSLSPETVGRLNGA